MIYWYCRSIKTNVKKKRMECIGKFVHAMKKCKTLGHGK